MYQYSIKFQIDDPKFDYVNFPNLTTYLEEARMAFNQLALQRRKDRSIETPVVLEQDGFVVVLNSGVALDFPSKALSIFSKALIDTGAFDRFVSGNNHLLRSVDVKDITEHQSLTDCELLTILVRWIVEPGLNESPATQRKRNELITDIKTLLLNADMIL